MASHFNVIDRIVARQVNDSDANRPVYANSVPMRIVAVWRADDNDYADEFESEIRMILQPRNEIASLHSDTFRFTLEKPKHRITVMIAGF